MIYPQARYLSSGDQYLTVEIGDDMTLESNFKVLGLDLAIKAAGIPGLVETLPGWRSILVHFDSLVTDVDRFIDALREAERSAGGAGAVPSRVIELPVLYGGRYGPDLGFVAQANGLASPEEAAARHAASLHWVGMVGFTPGSPQLKFLDETKLMSVPKYTRPRLYTPEGCIGLGGSITAIYPVVSPGGYQMMGLTPVPIYDRFQSLPDFEESPILLRLGDRVRFVPVTLEECDAVRQQVRECTYRITIKEETVTLEDLLRPGGAA